MKHLFFDYQFGSKIRFKKSNCFKHIERPYVYRIKTEKLDFIIPRKMVYFTDKYVYIPLHYYSKVLMNYYLNL